MKKDKEEAVRWLKQAKYNLEVASNDLKYKYYSTACFMSEQSAQMALKSFIIFKMGRSNFKEHSVYKLALNCSAYDKDFSRFIDLGKILDKYYIPTRYPDALAFPVVPYEAYTYKEAKQSIEIARDIVEVVSKKIR